ncbi:hypothetical protein GYMLUDRAFT_105293, partial [Collybiopsis luxurians FD-317 M1]
YPPPLILSCTQEETLGDLRNWANSSSTNHMFWLCGMAETGKSTITQTFAKTCAENGFLVGRFFFRRTDTSRNNSQQLFTTIALQMALANLELRFIINSVVEQDPSVLTSSTEDQLERLILQP